jgi:hypothetical protein
VPVCAVAVDAEWDDTQGRHHAWISTQLHAPATGRTVVFIRSDLPGPGRRALEDEARQQGVLLRFIDRADDDNVLRRAMPELFPGRVPRRVDLLVFFSPRDVEYAVGWPLWSEAVRAGQVSQHRGLSGGFGLAPRVRVRDVSGWLKTSLKNTARALGVPAGDKGIMDAYKANMSRGLRERPRDFIRYAVGDAVLLPLIYDAFVGLLNGTLRDTLGVPERFLFEPAAIPMSTGRLVSAAFTAWLAGGVKDRAAYLLCLLKLGYLDTGSDNYLSARERRADLLGRVRGRADVRALEADELDAADLAGLANDEYVCTAVNACGVPWWASRANREQHLQRHCPGRSLL